MFLQLQFPIVDSRLFVTEKSYRLQAPAFPLASLGEFLRLHGAIRFRQGGGVEEWSGEEVFSQANRALRFPTAISGSLIRSLFKCVFRRFYSDGEAVARIEVGTCITVSV